VAHEPRLAVESLAGRRDYQEDSVLAQALSDGRVLVAVADGMGGHAAGEVASALALETLVSALEDGVELDESFQRANAEVNEKAREPGKKGMGTTLVAALIDGEEYLVANVGDSRAYVLSGNGIRQLSLDHSFAAEAERHGQPIAEEMAIRYKDALTRSIGTEEQVEVDVFGPFPVKEDTALVICSDGLYKVMEAEPLRRVFVQSSGPRGAAQALVTTAFDDGSDDNISVAIAEFGEVPRVVTQGTMPIDFVPGPHPEPDSTPEESDSDQTSAHEHEPDADGGGSETETAPAARLEHAAANGGGVPMGAIVAAVVAIGALIVFFAF